MIPGRYPLVGLHYFVAAQRSARQPLGSMLRTERDHRVHMSGEAAIQAVRDRIQQATDSAAELKGQAEAAQEEMQELQQERDAQSGGHVKALSTQADDLAKRYSHKHNSAGYSAN